VEAFTAAYPDCRYVVASRIVGYKGPARLGEAYATTTIRDFLMSDVERFLCNWHRAVAVGQMGPGRSAEAYAEKQTQALLRAIQENERIRELAINPLMLTVIALVHRDRVKLPDRRAELYDEAVNVLLGKWDEARGVQEIAILEDRPFDAGDRRLMLQAVALWMQEQEQKEIEADDLRRLLGERFHDILGDWRAAERAIDRFLRVIRERTGLLGEHGLGVYRFSHLTFQEYLSAVAVAGRDDYVAYTLERAGNPWWREVILLEAGHLSTQSREQTTRLIEAIAERREEPDYQPPDKRQVDTVGPHLQHGDVAAEQAGDEGALSVGCEGQAVGAIINRGKGKEVPGSRVEEADTISAQLGHGDEAPEGRGPRQPGGRPRPPHRRHCGNPDRRWRCCRSLDWRRRLGCRL
jgi:predicted NACHT family NTPase